MIDFKSYEEQIEILKSRGLIIDNDEEVISFLKANNYYNVINAYKDIFIRKGICPEKFINGTTFNEIVAIHSFDKDLRILLSNYLIIIERLFKSIIAYEFSKRHGNHDIDYLNIDNFDNKGISVIEASKLTTTLNNELHDAIAHNDEMICHYKAKYERIPLWVFANKISFGNISKFFSVMKSGDKYAVAKSISSISGQKVKPSDIKNAIRILVFLRNKAAHDQRIYDFNSKPNSVSGNNHILKKYDLNNVQSLFGALACMSLFLTPKQYKTLCSDIKKLIEKLFLKIHSIPTQVVLSKMGVPQKFLVEK